MLVTARSGAVSVEIGGGEVTRVISGGRSPGLGQKATCGLTKQDRDTRVSGVARDRKIGADHLV